MACQAPPTLARIRQHAVLSLLAAITLWLCGCERVRDLATPRSPSPTPSPAAAGPRIYVTDGLKGVYAISCADQQVAEQFPIAGGASDLHLSADGRVVYATSSKAGQVMAFQSNGVPLGRIAVGGKPMAMAFSPDGRTAYVANSDSKDVSVVDLVGRRETGRIATREAPYDIVAPEAGRFWVCLHDGSEVALFDAQAGREMTRVRVGLHPYHLALDPEGQYLYATVFDENVLVVLDARTGAERARITTGDGPYAVAASRGGQVYVTNLEGGSLTVVERGKWEAPREVAVGSRPTTLALTPDGERVYVVLEGDENIQVVTAANPDQRTALALGTVPVAIFSGGKTVVGPAEGSSPTASARPAAPPR